MEEHLTPAVIVEELDRYIVGQEEAKRAVAIALRNRYRRSQLSAELQEEIVPKNILMIGPTGVGKTEIARRLARLVRAPFIKVEATKFTEVGYVGRDVESMVRDLTDIAVRMVEEEALVGVKAEAERGARRRILDLLMPARSAKTSPATPPWQWLAGSVDEPEAGDTSGDSDTEESEALRRRRQRRELGEQLDRGEFDERVLEIEVEERPPSMIDMFSGSGMEELGLDFQNMFGNMFPARRATRRVTVKEALRVFTAEEAGKLIDAEQVKARALERVESSGIIFIDELDKVTGSASPGSGPDVSREGVQRDILPIIEGSTVMTKHGPVRTDHILFIAAGAFHVSKPADLIPELQGRLPIRVELNPLTQADLCRILVEPDVSLTRQYCELLAVDGVQLEFTEDAIQTIARIAEEVNDHTENIGARRLHTILEKLLQGVSFAAPNPPEARVIIDEAYVEERLASIVRDRDLTRYIL